MPPQGLRFACLSLALVTLGLAPPPAATAADGDFATGRPPAGGSVFQVHGIEPDDAGTFGPPKTDEGNLLRAATPIVAGAFSPRAEGEEAPAQLAQIPQIIAPPVPDVPPAPPAPGPFDPEAFRPPPLGVPPELRTPRPDPQTLDLFGRFVDRTIDPQNTLDIVVGRPRVLVFHEAPRRVYIPQEEVAAYQVVTDRELAIVGVAPGSTVLNLWFADPDDPLREIVLSYLVRVVPDPEFAERLEQVYGVLEEQINETFPDSLVRLALVGDQVVVRGQAKDVVEAAQILRIVAEHAPPGRRTRADLREVPVGFFVDAGEAEAAATAIRELLQGTPNLVNLLKIPGEQQVMLMVTVAEVNRTAARSVGIDFSIAKGAATVGQITGGMIAAAGGNPGPMSNLPMIFDDGEVALAINALRSLNLARTLAEPNLTTINGRPAEFHAGGSFPVPRAAITPGGAAQDVAFMPFGVQLQFTPYITDRDRIRLELAAEVSTRSEATTAVNGASVPSQLDRRTFSTTVELREGQTLAVAGLIQTNYGADARRIPLWGDLPLLGRTGGMDRATAGEQEVVVLVTPVLVHPLDGRHTPPLPGSDVFEPDDVEFYLLGRLEGRRHEDYRSPVRTDLERQRRFRHCPDMFIIGPHGSTYGCHDVR